MSSVKNNQPMIPGLDDAPAPAKPFGPPLRPLLQRIAALESRILQLELEISLLRIQMEKERR